MTSKTRLASAAVAASLALAGVGVGLGATSASAGPVALSSSTAYVPWISGTATPAVNGLRLRSGPSTHYAAYGLLYRGDRMRVTAEQRRPGAGTWFKVTLTRRSASGLRSGHAGWVYASYLRHL